MSDIQIKTTKHAKKQENITYHQEEKKTSKEADPEMTQVLYTVNKDIKSAIIHILYNQKGRGRREHHRNKIFFK